MVAVNIKHSFVSTKPDSPDPTVVSSSEWNAPLVVSAGATGQVLVRNGAEALGASYIDGATVQRVSDSFIGSASTTPAMSLTTVTFTSNGVVLLVPNMLVVLATGTGGTLSIQRNGVNIVTGPINCSNVWFTPFTGFSIEVPGTYTYNILISGSTGVVTNAQTVLNVLKLGTV